MTIQIEGDLDKALAQLDYAASMAELSASCAPSAAAFASDYQAAASRAPLEVRSRLDRVLMGADPEAGLDVLLGCGALGVLLPSVESLVGFGDGEWRHKDVWKHTKQVVRQAVPRLEVRWAALLHDIGKVKTRSIAPDGQVHFFGHAEVGARMFDRLERKLGLFREERTLQSTVRFLILHHLRANQYESDWTDSAVRRFAKEMGQELDNLLCLARADITTKRPEKKRHGLEQIEELSERIQTLAAEDAVVPPLPSGIGNLIMEAFSVPPGRLIGEVKRALEKAIEDGELAPHEPGSFYIDYLSQNRARFGLP